MKKLESDRSAGRDSAEKPGKRRKIRRLLRHEFEGAKARRRPEEKKKTGKKQRAHPGPIGPARPD